MRTLTFAEAVAAVQAQLGQKAKISIEDKRRHRIRHTDQGVLKPGLDSLTELVPDEDGRLVFRIVPSAWLCLDPRAFMGAQEEPDRRLLRVELREDAAFLIQTLP